MRSPREEVQTGKKKSEDWALDVSTLRGSKESKDPAMKIKKGWSARQEENQKSIVIQNQVTQRSDQLINANRSDKMKTEN